jgi:sugar O-acyltransferase (sialic acid O-acetyltransferase NeuD family)
MKNVLIIGASGHGSVILDSIERSGEYNVIGFIDSFKPKGQRINGYEILGNEANLPSLIEKFNIFGGIVAIGDNWTRKNVVDRITHIFPDFEFITVIHPLAIVGKDVTIGQGTVLMPGAVVNANSVVGNHCIINTNSSLGHDGRMENYTSLASGVTVGGNCHVGWFSAISLGAKVIENITIMDHTIIGAGSLVLGDIPGNVVAYGSPARIIRKRKAGEQYLAGTSRKWSGVSIAKV